MRAHALAGRHLLVLGHAAHERAHHALRRQGGRHGTPVLRYGALPALLLLLLLLLPLSLLLLLLLLLLLPLAPLSLLRPPPLPLPLGCLLLQRGGLQGGAGGLLPTTSPAPALVLNLTVLHELGVWGQREGGALCGVWVGVGMCVRVGWMGRGGG